MSMQNNRSFAGVILQRIKMLPQAVTNSTAEIGKSDILYGLYSLLTTFLCPILIYILYNHTDLLILSLLSSMFTTRMDPGGLYGSRLRMMSIGAFLLLASYFLAAGANGNTFYTILAMFLWPFFLRMLCVFGREMLRPVSIAIIGLIIYLSRVSFSSMDYTYIYTILLSMFLPITIRLLPWPFSPYQPARVIISDYYQAIQVLFRREYSALLMKEISQYSEDEQQTRLAAAQKARKQYLLMIKGLNGRFNRTTWNLYLLAKKADSLFALQAALSEDLQGVNLKEASPPAATAFKTALEICEMQFSNVHDLLEKKHGTGYEGIADIALAKLKGQISFFERNYNEATDEATSEIQSCLHTLAAYIKTLQSALKLIGHPADMPCKSAAKRSLGSILADTLDKALVTLKARPNILGDAVFFSAFLSLAAGISIAYNVPHGYWISLTVAIILKDNFQETLQKALARVFGTLSGGLIAIALSSAISNKVLILWIIVVFWLVAMINSRKNYSVYVFFWTPVIIFLLNTGNLGDLSVASERMVNTCFGGALSLFAILVYYLTLEQSNIRRQTAAALSANREFMHSVFFMESAGRDPSRIEKLCLKAIGECTDAAAYINNGKSDIGSLILLNQRLCGLLADLNLKLEKQEEHNFTGMHSLYSQLNGVLENVIHMIRTNGRGKSFVGHTLPDSLAIDPDKTLPNIYCSELIQCINDIQHICMNNAQQ